MLAMAFLWHTRGRREKLLRLARGAGLCIVPLGLLGCASQGLTGGGGVPSPSAEVNLCNSTDASCAATAALSLQSLRDLNIVVNWQNVPQGTHAQTINVFLPDGNLYQTLEKSFEVPEGAAGPMATQAALPVAGTWITQRGLSGSWKVTLDLDGKSMSSQTVQLNP